MALTPNQRALIKALERLETLEDRFSDLRCVNASDSTVKVGYFSLVFEAVDRLDGEKVAVKFLDPARTHDVYRAKSFEREPEILEGISERARGLKLVAGLETFKRSLSDSVSGESIELEDPYFVTEWLSEGVGGYFWQACPVLSKLAVFRSICLALQAVHQSNVTHRDLKVENIRIRSKSPELICVVIDFGTAARFDSKKLRDQYRQPVGDTRLSAPESYVGLSGSRHISACSDIYMLGTLFFDLFEPTQFHVAREWNGDFAHVCRLISERLASFENDAERANAWSECMRDFRFQLKPPAIGGVDSFLPAVIKNHATGLYNELTAFDFQSRISDYNYLLRRVDSLTKMINVEDSYQRRLASKRALRSTQTQSAVS